MPSVEALGQQEAAVCKALPHLWAWKLCEGVRLVQDDPRGLESHDAVCWACRVGCVRATASSTPAQSCFFSLRFTDADPTSVCIPRLAWRLLSRSPINNFCWCMSVSVCVHTCKRVSKHVTVCVCNRVCECTCE